MCHKKSFWSTTVHTGTETGVQREQEQGSETNRYRRLTDLKRASDKTGTDRTTAVGGCRECWRIPANDTYVPVKSDKLAYKGVKLCVLVKNFDREDECPFGTKSYPRSSRLVHARGKMFIVLERYSCISTNSHSSFLRRPCSGVLARRGLHYHK